MSKEELKDKKKSSYWWTVILIVIIGFWIYFYNQPDENVTFVVKPGHWLTCWEDTSNMTISYDLSSSLAVDLLFTPTQEDAENLTAISKHYASCYISNVLENKGSCVIAGKGCMVLLNKNVDDAIISLKYSAKRI